MELKEYLNIFKKNIKWFFFSIIVVLFFGFLGQFLLGNKYKVELDLNITRTGFQKDTNEYRYDEFYRLQADEKFSDTVVEWIKSSRVREDVANKSEKSQFSKLKGERLSSQMIRVSFLVENKNEAEKISKAIGEILNIKTDELNLEQNNPSWFKILASKPVVIEYKFPLGKLIFTLLVAGVFVGFWVVMIRHYWE